MAEMLPYGITASYKKLTTYGITTSYKKLTTYGITASYNQRPMGHNAHLSEQI